MRFKKETRTISKKGSFTIPVQIRRALGIYSKTQVDIEEGQDSDVLMLIKTRPHCICCGKVGKTLVRVNRDSINPKNSRFVCEECIGSLNEALAQGDTITHEITPIDVIDNYNINLQRMEEIGKENAEYERIIQQEGISKLGPEKTVTLNGRNSDVKVQISYTVKDVTKAGFDTLKSYMNESVSDTYLAAETVEKFNANADFKKAAVIIYTEDWQEGSFVDTLAKHHLKDKLTDAKLARIESRWKLDDLKYDQALVAKALGIDDVLNDDLFKELNLVAKYNYVKQIFPKIESTNDIDLLRDCLIVNSCIKIKK